MIFKNNVKKRENTSSTSVLTNFVLYVWKRLESFLIKIFKGLGFIFKYCSLGVHYILDFIIIKVVLSSLIFLYIKTKNIVIKLKEKAIKNYHNSKSYKNKMLKLEMERNDLLNSVNSEAKRSEEAKMYRYKVKDASGKIKTGFMNGLSKMDVLSYLNNEGYTVYKLETSKLIQFIYGSSSVGAKMSTKDLIFWLTQLSTYVKAGIPLTEALKILSKQLGQKGKQKKLFDSLIFELTMGNSFSRALEKQKGVFPSLLINMIKAAEATGELEKTLDEMVDYYTEINSTKKQMVSAMTYPAIITIFSFAVIIFIVLYIIPKFTGIYDSIGAKITGITAVVVKISDFLIANIAQILLVIVVIVIVFIFAYKKIKSFRELVQNILMKIPVLGKVIMYNELTIFTKTFASLLKNNVFITESMNILSKITNNEIYKKIMYTTISNIAKGDKISDSFKDHWAIPDVAYYMIVTGESTGELPSMMEKVSQYYQQEHRTIISQLKSLIEPIMIVFLAVIVGVIVISIIMPMFALYGEVGF